MNTSGSSTPSRTIERGRIGAGCEADRAGRLAGLTARASGRAAATLASWGPRVALSILDQGLVSGANFLLNILLARWLPLAEYGAFSVAFTLFLFLSGFHNALVLEPMSVLGPARYRCALPHYLLKLLWMHAGLMVGLGVCLALAGLVFGGALGSSLVGLGIVLPVITLFWLARRACYVETIPGRAAASGLVYAMTVILGAIVVRHVGWLVAATGLAVMGAAGLAASGVWLGRLHSVAKDEATFQRDDPGIGLRSIFSSHWEYGRWMIATAVLSLGIYHIQTLLAAASLGLEAAAVLRAMFNLVLPMSQVITALSVLMLPQLAADFARGDLGRFHRKGQLVTAGLTGAAVLYEVALLAAAGPVSNVVFGGRFASYQWLARVLGATPILTALASGYSLMLRAAQKPEHYLIAATATAPVSVISTIVLASWHGVLGAALSSVLVYGLGAAIAFALYKTWIPDGA